MKKMIQIVGFVLAGLAFSSCAAQRSAQSSEACKVTENNSFAFALYNNIESLSESKANVLVSPYSAAVALAMLKEGATDKTAEEISTVLGDFDYTLELVKDPEVKLNCANSAWINQKYHLNDNYKQTLDSKAHALVSELDFADPKAPSIVNNWCAENTDGKIQAIVDRFNPQDVLLLVNALHFKAEWISPFTRTSKDVFHGTSGDKKVTYMHRNKYASYAETKQAKMVSLDMGSGLYKMHFILPGDQMVLSESVFRKLLTEQTTKKINLTMPEFKAETSMSLVESLKALGIKKAFTSSADLSGIGDGPLVVNDVAQKTYIDVNKDGCEAAAVTSISVALTSVRPEPSIEMVIDRPFYFLITDEYAQNILFIGKTNNVE